MIFSDYLKIIYKAKNNNITTQDEFVKQLFISSADGISYSDEYYKKLFQGSRVISSDIREYMNEHANYEKTVHFFNSNINELRLNDLFNDFKIDKEQKKDLKIFSEALSIMFEIYMKYEHDKIYTSVNTIYEVLLDQHGNGSIVDANEKALFAAKEYFYQSIKSLTTIKSNNDVLSLKGNFESFFQYLYNSYRAFESNCNLEGKRMYNSIKNQVLKDNSNDTNYLKLITEPGTRPIELQKDLSFVIYDNYTFKDKDLNLTIKLFDEQENEQILKQFKEFKFYPVNEIFFTQYIEFKLSDDDDNILKKSLQIINLTQIIFNSIEKYLKEDYEPLVKINDKLNIVLKNLKQSTIQYIIDGTYYPKTGNIEYHPSVTLLLGNGKNLTETGQDKFNINHYPVFMALPKDISFHNRFHYLFNYQHHLWKNMFKYDDPMVEFFTINKDGTFRLFLVPPTSKSRIYRLIRDITTLVTHDHIIGFYYTGVMTINRYQTEDELKKYWEMPYEERLKIGEDQLFGLSFNNGTIFTSTITKSESIRGDEPKFTEIDYSIFIPLMTEINKLNQ